MEKVFIIAEAGINHNGNVNIAKKLIDIAVAAGADAVKFQTYKTENVLSRNIPKAEYQIRQTNSQETYFDMAKKLELSEGEFVELNEYCKGKGTVFLSTPFDIESIYFLSRLELKTFKIGSGEITYLPFLREVGRLDKKVIISTGASSMEEVKRAFYVLIRSGTNRKNITVLHCNTEYPTPVEDVNLKAMLTIKDELNCRVGYSDHTRGLEVSIAAVALGAKVIEKHFTLDNEMEGPDHQASLNPEELKNMVDAIRNIEKAMGTGVKNVSSSEKQNKQIVRRSIVASKQIIKGEVFSDENITARRPGSGISPMAWDTVIGKTAKRDFEKGSLIEL